MPLKHSGQGFLIEQDLQFFGQPYVALDAGHGENTWETTGGKGVPGMEEHWFNATVVTYAKQLAEANGIKVLLTQPPFKNDVGLSTRYKKANAANVDVCISVHANASGYATNHGACAFYWHTSQTSRRLADIWVSEARKFIEEVGFHGNGRHASMRGSWTNLAMVRETNMPALLIEHGFMTNKGDLEHLKSDAFRRDCAEAIVRMLCRYFGIAFKHGFEVSKAAQKPKVELDKRVAVGDVKADKIRVKVDDLHTYNTADWKDKTGPVVDKGDVFTVHRKLLVDGYPMYQLISGVYITGASEYVEPYDGAKKEPSRPYPGTVFKVKSPMMKGSNVKLIQLKIGVKTDGYYGPATERAVKSWQKKHGLSADGMVGPNTWSKMFG